MNDKKRRVSLIFLLFILSISTISATFAFPAEAARTAGVTDEGELIVLGPVFDRPIAVVYSPSNEIVIQTAMSIRDSLKYYYRPVILAPIMDFSDYDAVTEDAWIVVHVYDSNPEGPILASGQGSWKDLQSVILSNKDQKHVLAIPNSAQAAKNLGVALQFARLPDERSELADAELLGLYSLWMVADILETESYDSKMREVGVTLRSLTLKYFAENLDTLVSRGYDPVVPMGKENLTDKEARFNKLIDPSRGKAFWVSPSGERIPVSQAFNAMRDQNYALVLGDGDLGSIIVDTIPVKTGIEGPAGKIVDMFLKTLIKEGVNSIDLPPDVANAIGNATQYIPKVLGIIKDPSVENILKLALDIITEQFPNLNETRPYLELAIEAFSAFRGNATDIIKFVSKALEVFFPSQADKIKDITDTILDLNVDELADNLAKGEDAFKSITKWMTSLLTSKFLNETLSSWLGVNLSSIVEDFQGLVALVKGTISAFQDQDILTFITQTIPETFTALKPLIDKYILNSTSPTYSSSSGIGINQIQVTEFDLSKLDPLLEMAKIIFWSVAKTGGLPDPKKFLEEFPVKDIINSLIQKLYEAVGETYPDKSQQVKEMVELLKGILNGTKSVASEIQSQIDSIVPQLLSSISDSSVRSTLEPIVKEIFEAVSAIISGKGDVLRTQAKDVIEDLLIKLKDFLFDQLPDDAKQMVTKVLKFFMSGFPKIMSVLTGNSALARAALLDFSLTPEQILDKLKDVGLDYINEGIEFLLSKIPGLNSTQLQTLQKIVEKIPKLVLSMLTSSFEAKSSWISVLRQLAYFFLNIGIEKLREYLPNFDMDLFLDVANGIYESAVEGKFSVQLPDLRTSVNALLQYLEDQVKAYVDPTVFEAVKFVIGALTDLKQFFQDGLRWLVGELIKWAKSFVSDLLDDLFSKLNKALEGFDFLKLEGEFPVGIGGFNAFTLTYSFILSPNLDIDTDAIASFLLDIIFEGNKVLTEIKSVGDVMKKIFSFVNLAPVFSAKLGVKGLNSEESPLLQVILGALGVELDFSGEAYFKVLLFSIGANGFDMSKFFKVIEWGLKITIKISRDITILDIVSGGVGGGALNTLGKYIGLDAIKITIGFSIMLAIVMMAETATKPASGTLTVQFTISAGISLGIDVVIAAIGIYAGVEIIFTFIQNLLDLSTPLKITFTIKFILRLTLEFLFISKDFELEWEPPGFPIDLTPSKSDPTTQEKAMGYDGDDDGLTDEFEKTQPGLDTKSDDTDGDGLTDKEELKYSLTDPTVADSDGDGLTDYEEYIERKTDPNNIDSDYDGLTDFEEAIIIGTDPLNFDTDGDSLTDYYEVTHAWNITGITPSVTEVIIGGKSYSDRTDPLNPDTDNDGLLDGQEGEFGPKYGEAPSNESEGILGTLEIIFNNGYTHPLDNDTDDDSYMQAYDGEILPSRIYFGDMRDGVEVAGIEATIIEYGDFVTKVFYTNPIKPDSDVDTGPPEPGRVMLSDGYELYYNDPATNPLNGDSDGDGLIDGLEAFSGLSNFKTDPSNPDTDGDGLGDMTEVLRGTNPREADTDEDLVPDGEEYLLYGTNPLYPDSDFDGLLDGEELYLYHSNPWMEDSDGDGISDGDEVTIYGTDPMDEDSDNDDLPDRDEIFIHNTDPFNPDTDGDGLRDGEEVYVYSTNPLDMDTDGDGIWYPNEFGDPTFPWTDYQEVNGNNSDPLVPDTDGDGLPDGIEVYLGTGLAPDVPIMALDPKNNDTDGDGLTDGYELVLLNESALVYPYRALMVFNPFNSSPVLADTDGDGVDDWTEINNGMRPDYWDTDGDYISDYMEYYQLIGVSPTSPDSDGDGIPDPLELLKDKGDNTIRDITYYYPDFNFTLIENLTKYDIDSSLIPTDLKLNFSQIENRIYQTYSWTSDSDSDKLPDGAEIVIYSKSFGYDPAPGKDDTNSNGVIDGYDQDLDNDGLLDGDEFYGENATHTIGWGIFDPDTDHDALLDGAEVKSWGTYPNNWDTDGDNYSDGFEVIVGSNPVVFTTPEEMAALLARFAGPLIIWSPENEILYKYGDIPIIVFNITTIESSWYRYREEDSSSWSGNTSLTYDNTTNPGLWRDDTVSFPEGRYILQAFGKLPSGKIVMDEIFFGVNATAGGQPFYSNPWFIGGASVLALGAAGGTSVAVVRIRRKGIGGGGGGGS